MSFLFAPESPRRVAAMRIGLGGLMLYDAALRWPFVVELYSREGMPMPLHPGTNFEPTALSAATSCALYALLLFVLAAVALGWRTRLSLLAGLVLSGWFGVLDTAGTFKKYSVIALHLSFLLLFCESAAVWSIDGLLNPNHRRLTRLTPAWPRRLMQFLIVSVYFGAVVTKVRRPDFSGGELLMFSLLDDRWGGNWFGMWLATRPKLLVLASYGTLLIEFAAVFLLWVRRTRIPMLVLLAAFHLSIGWSMHVGIFSPIMLLGLLAFVQEPDMERIGRQFSRLSFLLRSYRGTGPNRVVSDTAVSPPVEQTPPRFSGFPRRVLLSLAAYATVAAACASAGYLLSAKQDGVILSRETTKWTYFDKETMEEILIGDLPHPRDFFHQVSLGSRYGHGLTFGSADTFSRGMTVYAVARLQQWNPRFDQRNVQIQADWILLSPQGEEVGRVTQFLQPGLKHILAGFEMTGSKKTTLGSYTLELRANGITVTKRSFELVAD